MIGNRIAVEKIRSADSDESLAAACPKDGWWMDIEIRILTPDDVTGNYVSWFDDEEVMLFSDNRFRRFSLEGQKAYVLEKLQSENEFLYGIFADNSHIGNVMLGPVNRNHLHAEVTYMLGDKRYWGKGVMSRAITDVVQKAFSEHKLYRVFAGTYANNTGSVKVLEKCGFELEGRRKSHFLHEAQRVDMLEYGRLRPDSASA